MTIEDHERYPLYFGPSPVHRLPRLTERCGGAQIWAKRDDVACGIGFGGNKTRKLEYLVADALATGCDTLVTIGATQSNHTRQVASVAAHLGLRSVLVHESWVHWPDPAYDKVGNVLIDRVMGAEIRAVEASFGIEIKASWEQAVRDEEAAGHTPYAIPAGGSDHPLGGLGYAYWAHELAAQEAELGVFFDTIVLGSGTGSTQGGMLAGFAALAEAREDRPRRVVGIDVCATPAETRAAVLKSARQTAGLLGVSASVDAAAVELDDRYNANVYGIADETTVAAIELAARTEGMLTDPVYEGKSMAGLIDLVTRAEIPATSNVLFAHLGGQPAINAYSELFH